VKIRRADFTTYTRQKRFTPPTNDTRTITAVASGLLTTWLNENPGARVRLLGVGASQLTEADQMDLFATPTASAAASPAPPANASRLDTALDAIRQKFGANALTRAGNLEDKN
jgi:DNA polymerase-4